MWYSPDANVRLHAESSFGIVPGIPSLIVTANRVDQFLSNTGSFSGSFTGNFTGSLLGTATTASFLNSTTNAFIQNGNSFGTTALLGTNDSQSLALETSGSTRMFISSSGNIGIGTITPTALLHISGASSANLLRIDSLVSSSIIFVSGSGNVGIGTAAPTVALQVGDTTSTGNYIRVLGTGSGTDTTYDVFVGARRYPRITLQDTTVGGAATFQLWNLGSQMRFGTNAGAQETSAWYTKSGNAADVIFNGNVGIGISSPTAKLNISGSVNISGSGTQVPLQVSSGSTSLLFVSSSGNVGIGTTAPTFKLDVSGSARVQNNLSLASGFSYISLGNNVNLRSNLAGGSGFILDAQSFNTLNSTTLEQGFGMFSGTFAPTSGTGTLNGLKITPTINQTGGANGITKGLFINPTLTAAADFRAIETTVGNVILGSTSGNVGIGIASPTAKLDVSGSARITNGLTVTGSLTVNGTTTITGTATGYFIPANALGGLSTIGADYTISDPGLYRFTSMDPSGARYINFPNPASKSYGQTIIIINSDTIYAGYYGTTYSPEDPSGVAITTIAASTSDTFVNIDSKWIRTSRRP
jgi:hypothetical protein